MGYLLQWSRRCSSSSSVVLPLFLVFFLAIFLGKSVSVVSALEYFKDKQASSSTLESIQKYLAEINKPAVMSIETPDGIIDCVDKWKQPAFDHPLLKNHSFQLVSPEVQRPMRTKVEEVKGDFNIPMEALSQGWHKNGTRCPKGTVPIIRVTVEDVLRAGSIHNFQRKPQNTALAALNVNVSISADDDFNINDLPHEYAVVQSKPGTPIHGVSAGINVWNPHVGNEGEMSISQIWVASGQYQFGDLNTIEVGWQVYPRLYRDSKTHLFVYWTADAYRSTGCYNLRCPGFVQVHEEIIVGSILNLVSTKSGQQYESLIQVYKDRITGDWWLAIGSEGTKVGFWPASLFTTLKDSAEEVQWGGEITDRKLDGAHTATEMGSNRFAQEGYAKASYFRQLNVMDSNNVYNLPTDTTIRIDNANCYNLDLRYTLDFLGVHFFYGGPGNLFKIFIISNLYLLFSFSLLKLNTALL